MPHFTRYVRDLLEEAYGAANVARKGYKVLTTLDYDMQRSARKRRKGVDERGSPTPHERGLVALDPKNGQILAAMVGSHDFNDKENDGGIQRRPERRASPDLVQAHRLRRSLRERLHAGYDALGRGYGLQTDLRTTSRRTTISGAWRSRYVPRSGSLNIAAVKALYLVGVGRVIDFAENLGYTTLGDRSRSASPSCSVAGK